MPREIFFVSPCHNSRTEGLLLKLLSSGFKTDKQKDSLLKVKLTCFLLWDVAISASPDEFQRGLDDFMVVRSVSGR